MTSRVARGAASAAHLSHAAASPGPRGGTRSFGVSCLVARTPSRRRRHPGSFGLPPAAAAGAAAPAAVDVGHTLPDGVRLELLHAPATAGGAAARPPLLFVHGSYHAAWCWQDHWLPHFAAAGFECWAVSLRGQGNSGIAPGSAVAGTLASHAADLASVAAALPAPPVLVGHSFGALLCQRFVVDALAAAAPAAGGAPPRRALPLAGVALLCGVPPSGNGGIVRRIAAGSLAEAARITWAFATRSFGRSAAACRATFFSADAPEADVERARARLASPPASAVRLLDLRALGAELPLPRAAAARAAADLPAFVGGGAADRVVDAPALAETADWLGLEGGPTVWEGVAHDCMLDTRWRAVADDVLAWLGREWPAGASS